MSLSDRGSGSDWVSPNSWRVIGAVLMLACVLSFDASANTLLQRLLLPLAMGIATALVVKNVLVAGIAGTALAGIHTNFAGDWVTAIAYPVIAALSLVICIYILGARFKRRIIETRETRWHGRTSEVPSNQNGEQE